mmetsp:Transcript_69112/g.158676  ORF Transcript_69112/g.158676 Transcript_69112/m.158676 type:complete len:242 (+) Transcript_69112:390-1115(+)
MLWCLVFKVTRRSLAEASALATRSFAVACILAARALAASFFARNFCLCCAISRAARSFCARFLAFAASRAALALSTFTCSSCFFWARITSRPVAFSQASCLPEALYSTMAFLYSAISASNLVLYWSFSGAGKVSHFFFELHGHLGHLHIGVLRGGAMEHAPSHEGGQWSLGAGRVALEGVCFAAGSVCLHLLVVLLLLRLKGLDIRLGSLLRQGVPSNSDLLDFHLVGPLFPEVLRETKVS